MNIYVSVMYVLLCVYKLVFTKKLHMVLHVDIVEYYVLSACVARNSTGLYIMVDAGAKIIYPACQCACV